MAEIFLLSILLKVKDTAQAVSEINRVQHAVVSMERKATETSASSLALRGAIYAGAAGTIAASLYGLVEPAIEAQASLAHVATAMNDGAQQAQHLAEVQKFTEETSAKSVVTEEELASAYYIARSNNIAHAAALQAVQAATNLVTGTTKDAAAAQAALEPTTRTLTVLYSNFGGSISVYADQLAKLQSAYSFRDIGEVTNALSYAAPVAKNAGMRCRRWPPPWR